MKNLILTIFLILIAFSFCHAQNGKGGNVSLDKAKINEDWEMIKSDFLESLSTEKKAYFSKDRQDNLFAKLKNRIDTLTCEGNFEVLLKEDIWKGLFHKEQTINAYKEVANKFIEDMNKKYQMINSVPTDELQEKVDNIITTLSNLKSEVSELKNTNNPISSILYWLGLIFSPLLCFVFFYLYLKEKFTDKKTNEHKSKDVNQVMPKDNLSDEIKRLEKANKELLGQLDKIQNDNVDLQKKNEKLFKDYQTLIKMNKSKSDNSLLNEKDNEIVRLKSQVSKLQIQLHNSLRTTEPQPIVDNYKYLRQFNNGCFNIVQDNYDGQSLYRMFNIKENGTADFEFFGNEKELLANWSSMLLPICEFDGDPTKAEHVENDKRHPGKLVFDGAINRWKVDNKARVILS
ncbi:MAG: hypothetical protein IKP73_03340 [Bacteroidales bacterium]|nr:hypothetical protein [Bacteroidales bacterium]